MKIKPVILYSSKSPLPRQQTTRINQIILNKSIVSQKHSKPLITQPKFLIKPIQNSQTRQVPIVSKNKYSIIQSHKKTLPNPILTKVQGANYTNIMKLKDIGKGRILIIIAAGPSVLEVDFTPLLKIPTIDFMCINKPYKPVWPSKFWAFADQTQYTRNKETWDSYQGIIINSPNVTARKPNQVLITSRSGQGFSLDVAQGYFIGRSSTYANMQVAYYMNYQSIYIFGTDMGEVGGKLHHYGVNVDVAPELRKQRFKFEAEHYLYAGKNLPEDIRNKFIFCSSYNNWEFTKYFPKLDHKIAVEIIISILEARNMAPVIQK
jgi:hypothetical protein